MLLLFAARNPNNNADDMDAETAVIVLVIYGGFLLACLLTEIFFLLTLSRTLSQCDPRNRAMQPGMVWLNLIPLFNLVWQFVTVNRISQSLKDEFRDRGRSSRDDFGQSLGISTCCLILFGMCCSLATLGAIICGILYWVKIAGYKRELESSYLEDNWSDEDEEEEGNWDEGDDRPGRRRREDEGDDRPRKRRTEYGDDEDEHLR